MNVIIARTKRSPAPKPDPVEPSIHQLLDMVTKIADRAIARADAAEKAVADLRSIVADQTGLIKQLTANSATTATAIAALGTRLDTEIAAIDINAQVAVRRLDEEFTATVERIAAGVGELTTAIGDHERTTTATVATLRAGLPKSLMIDHAGDLIATHHDGEIERIGPVRGPAGRDAPEILDAVGDHGHIRFRMSNGTSVLAMLPALPSTPPVEHKASARTEDGDKVKEAIRTGILMNRNTGETFAAIGKKFNVTARTVSRIIREFEDAKDRAPNDRK